MIMALRFEDTDTTLYVVEYSYGLILGVDNFVSLIPFTE
jgi:hypothetical protein